MARAAKVVRRPLNVRLVNIKKKAQAGGLSLALTKLALPAGRNL
jgi:hypothetical protein